MTEERVLNLAVEDELSEAVALEILRQCGRHYEIGFVYRRGGAGALRKKITGFNKAARGMPFLVLTDLDLYDCPPELISQWLSVPRHPNLLLRIAVREIESWVMAHRSAVARFLGVAIDLVPVQVEEIENPKRLLVSLAGKSRRSDVRRDLVPPRGSTAKVGRNYNGALTRFVMSSWRLSEAVKRSPSLRRTAEVLRDFEPISAE